MTHVNETKQLDLQLKKIVELPIYSKFNLQIGIFWQ